MKGRLLLFAALVACLVCIAPAAFASPADPVGVAAAIDTGIDAAFATVDTQDAAAVEVAAAHAVDAPASPAPAGATAYAIASHERDHAAGVQAYAGDT
jgi:hypothetical protein